MSQDAFKRQSVVTDPGEYASLYDAVPDDIAGICRTVQGLLVHYFAGGYHAPADRICEIDSRYTTTMLQRILELDDRPLTELRPTEKRLVGCCRDYTVLTTSILRHKGIPARARYGTAVYFEAGYYCDHVVVEYWNGTRWVMVDSQMGPEYSEMLGIDFEVLDMPEGQFITGGRGWLMVRRENAEPDRFGLGSQSPIRGMPIILTETLLDLAALNGAEMLCWDTWGYSLDFGAMTEEDRLFIDKVAEATLDDSRSDEWPTLFQHEKLNLPATIHSFSPAVRPEEMPLTVQLKQKVV